MTPRRINYLLAFMAAGAMVAAANLGPPIARADAQQDAAFLALASRHGMTWGSADNAIKQGKAVCAELWAGKPLLDVAQDAYIYTELTSVDMANTFVAISIAVYCPAFSNGHGSFT